MPLWGTSDANTSAPKWRVLAGSNQTGQQMYQNVTPSAYTGAPNTAAGTFAVNGNGMHSGQVTAPGWILARQFCGPVTSIAVANDGASYANLSLLVVSNGTVSATGAIVVNSIGHVQSVTLDNPGAGFINTAAVSVGSPANGVATFTIGGGSGYANGEIVTVSNGISNATASITTNSTGGITAVTLVSPGWGGRGFAAANSTRAFVAITTVGGTNGNVSVATIGAGAGFLATVTLGGRAGRIQYETLIESSSLSVSTNSALFNA